MKIAENGHEKSPPRKEERLRSPMRIGGLTRVLFELVLLFCKLSINHKKIIVKGNIVLWKNFISERI